MEMMENYRTTSLEHKNAFGTNVAAESRRTVRKYRRFEKAMLVYSIPLNILNSKTRKRNPKNFLLVDQDFG